MYMYICPQGILERLKRSPDNVDIGWIYVDLVSIKDALISLTNKWMHVYATYLEKKVRSDAFESYMSFALYCFNTINHTCTCTRTIQFVHVIIKNLKCTVYCT